MEHTAIFPSVLGPQTQQRRQHADSVQKQMDFCMCRVVVHTARFAHMQPQQDTSLVHNER